MQLLAEQPKGILVRMKLEKEPAQPYRTCQHPWVIQRQQRFLGAGHKNRLSQHMFHNGLENAYLMSEGFDEACCSGVLNHSTIVSSVKNLLIVGR
jgi:hypothetical protein